MRLDISQVTLDWRISPRRAASILLSYCEKDPGAVYSEIRDWVWQYLVGQPIFNIEHSIEWHGSFKFVQERLESFGHYAEAIKVDTCLELFMDDLKRRPTRRALNTIPKHKPA